MKLVSGALDVHARLERVFLDEVAARLHHVAHQLGEQVISVVAVLDLDLKQGAGVANIGAAITAEISTMKVTEQIDALRVMAVSPVDYLIVPRMLACMIVVPILTVFGDVIGVFGGWLIAVFYKGLTTYSYMNSIHIFADLFDMTGGVIKAIFFGNVIAVLGCYYGLHCPDGAEGVGRATTKTVVASIIVIFLLNAVLTFLLY